MRRVAQVHRQEILQSLNTGSSSAMCEVAEHSTSEGYMKNAVAHNYYQPRAREQKLKGGYEPKPPSVITNHVRVDMSQSKHLR
jgi:uncharacterized protein with WD repeat